ncbi:hypothetical protein WBO78_22680 [Bosea sp. CCNWLW174]|uniref:hypothetical protein n=1 Tax=unclassified Bosea (in: a-proteobacteria) TaxID=2653178 RepID=UPI003014DAE2
MIDRHLDRFDSCIAGFTPCFRGRRWNKPGLRAHDIGRKARAASRYESGKGQPLEGLEEPRSRHHNGPRTRLKVSNATRKAENDEWIAKMAISRANPAPASVLEA